MSVGVPAIPSSIMSIETTLEENPFTMYNQ